MKKILFLAMIVLIVLFVINKYGLLKSDEEKIADCIESFETAVSAGNIKEIAKCLTKAQRMQLETIADISFSASYGGLKATTDISSLFFLGTEAMSEGDAMSLDIKEITLESDTQAIVSLEVTERVHSGILGTGDDKEIRNNAIAEMKKEGLDWHIADINLQ